MATKKTGRRKSTAMKDQAARQAILRAASAEFGREGFNGARTNAIAQDAGVNIALVFYYFQDKETLYRAVIEEVFREWQQRLRAALDSGATCTQKVQNYVAAMFDFLAAEPTRHRLVQFELLQDRRARRIAPLIKKHILPVRNELRAAVEDGIRSGEFYPADADQTVNSLAGVVVAYFNNAGVLHALTGKDPLSRARLQKRRVAVLDFVHRAVVRNR